MATAPAITLPLKADSAHVIATIDVIVKHLTALRAELSAIDEAVHEAPETAEPA